MFSAVIITKNEQEVIEDCLLSVSFADEILVIDTGNTDDTNKIAKSLGAKIIKSSPGTNYSQFRNDGLKAAHGDWILYVDADERVTPLLKKEIEQLIDSDPSIGAFEIPRRNIYLGKEMTHGGWGNDKVIRLFKINNLLRYERPLHEQPVFTGSLGTLKNELVHFSHRDLSSMLEKTIIFTNYEAELRFEQNHPPVVWWRLIRVMLTEFYFRFLKLSAARDGVEGMIDGLFQVFNMFVIYARLWELQYQKQK